MFTFYSKNSENQKSNERVTFVGTFSEGILKIAAARCSKKDQFARKKGFLIAQGRLNKNRLLFSQEMPVCSATDFVNIAKTLVENVIKTKVVLIATKVVEEVTVEPSNN